MHLYELSLNNFKNISEARLELSGKVNCFLGNNGMGKSNLLDAIYFLSFCKSFTGVNDRLIIRRGEEWAMVRGRYERKGVDEELTLGLAAGKRKTLKRSGKEYRRPISLGVKNKIFSGVKPTLTQGGIRVWVFQSCHLLL